MAKKSGDGGKEGSATMQASAKETGTAEQGTFALRSEETKAVQ
jgi:hypothetical protein